MIEKYQTSQHIKIYFYNGQWLECTVDYWPIDEKEVVVKTLPGCKVIIFDQEKSVMMVEEIVKKPLPFQPKIEKDNLSKELKEKKPIERAKKLADLRIEKIHEEKEQFRKHMTSFEPTAGIPQNYYVDPLIQLQSIAPNSATKGSRPIVEDSSELPRMQRKKRS